MGWNKKINRVLLVGGDECAIWDAILLTSPGVVRQGHTLRELLRGLAAGVSRRAETRGAANPLKRTDPLVLCSSRRDWNCFQFKTARARVAAHLADKVAKHSWRCGDVAFETAHFESVVCSFAHMGAIEEWRGPVTGMTQSLQRWLSRKWSRSHTQLMFYVFFCFC